MKPREHQKTGASAQLSDRHVSARADVGDDSLLRATQRMLAEAQAMAHLGGWEYDFATDRLMWSDETYRIFGLDPTTYTPTHESVIERIHRDDRENVKEDYAKAISERYPHDIECRIIRADGVIRNIHARGSTLYDSQGNPLRLVGSIQDVTDRKLMEDRLKNSQLQLATALELTRAGPWEYDVATNLFHFNDTFYAVFGTTAKEVGGYYMTPEEYARRFVPPDEIPVIKGEMQLALETSDPNFARELEHDFIYANGEIGVLAVKFRVLQDETGRTVRTYGVNQDITRFRRLQRELSLSKAMSATAVECSVEGILIVDRDMNIISHNNVFLEMWRVPKWLMDWRTDEVMLKFVTSQLKNPDSATARIEHLYGHPNETGHDKLELKDGRVFDRDSVPLFDDNGRYLARAWFFRDITKRICAERAVRESEENLRTIFTSVREGIFVMDLEEGKIIEVNPAGCEMFGYRREQVIGADIGLLSSGEEPFSHANALRLIHSADGESGEMDWHCKRSDGERFWAAVAIQRAPFMGKMVLLATLRDITERKQAEATIAQLARYDALTGLANRRVFVESLRLGISRAGRSKGYLAVLYLDLDHFKDVNDTLGHRVGDLLLKEVAQRIRSSVRDMDTVSRFGGDEFAVFAADLSAPEDAAVLAEKLLDALRQPFSIEGNEIRSGTSIGIATYGADSGDEDALLGHADVALYRAKAEGGSTFQFFTDEMDREVKNRVSLANELRSAISRGELELFYQPEVDLNSGDITGLEALVRWHHPTKGLLAPSEFIPAAERGGFIIDLGRWVMGEACRQAKAWVDLQIAPEFVAVNLSALQFKTPDELEKDIAKALSDHQLPPGMLELELTETVLMQTSQRNSDCLRSLRDKGIGIAIDDFGTGYSSLDYLRRFPAERIKIAQHFVADIESSHGNRTIVRAALGLARELGLGAVAEGIETHGQLMLLKSWGCREGQGYYFARPLPAAEATQLLRSRRGLYAVDEEGRKRAQGEGGEVPPLGGKVIVNRPGASGA